MLFKLKVKLFEYRFQMAQGTLENTSLIKITRRTIAQILTVLNERKEKFSNKDLAKYLKESEDEEKKEKGKKKSK